MLLAGLMRYLFDASALIWPRLSAALPPSRRRQTNSVMQVLALLLTLSPTVGNPWSYAIAVGGLLLLCSSFVADVIWIRHPNVHRYRQIRPASKGF